MRYAPATSSVEGLGCAKTRACCGAVECGSQTPDVFASSREANDALPTSGQPQRSRKLGVSSTFRAQLPFTSMPPRVVNTRDQMAAAEKDSNGFCSVHVFTHPGSDLADWSVRRACPKYLRLLPDSLRRSELIFCATSNHSLRVVYRMTLDQRDDLEAFRPRRGEGSGRASFGRATPPAFALCLPRWLIDQSCRSVPMNSSKRF